MKVSEAARMHEKPTKSSVSNTTVVTDEMASSTLQKKFIVICMDRGTAE